MTYGPCGSPNLAWRIGAERKDIRVKGSDVRQIGWFVAGVLAIRCAAHGRQPGQDEGIPDVELSQIRECLNSADSYDDKCVRLARTIQRRERTNDHANKLLDAAWKSSFDDTEAMRNDKVRKAIDRPSKGKLILVEREIGDVVERDGKLTIVIDKDVAAYPASMDKIVPITIRVPKQSPFVARVRSLHRNARIEAIADLSGVYEAVSFSKGGISLTCELVWLFDERLPRLEDYEQEEARVVQRAALQGSTASIAPAAGPDSKPGWFRITVKNPTETALEKVRVEILAANRPIKTVTISKVRAKQDASITIRLPDNAKPTGCRIAVDVPASQPGDGGPGRRGASAHAPRR